MWKSAEKSKVSLRTDERCMFKQKQQRKPAVRPLYMKFVDSLSLEPFNIEHFKLLRDPLSWRKTNFYFVHYKLIVHLTTPDFWSSGQEWCHDWQHRGRESVTDSVNSSKLKEMRRIRSKQEISTQEAGRSKKKNVSLQQQVYSTNSNRFWCEVYECVSNCVYTVCDIVPVLKSKLSCWQSNDETELRIKQQITKSYFRLTDFIQNWDTAIQAHRVRRVYEKRCRQD